MSEIPLYRKISDYPSLPDIQDEDLVLVGSGSNTYTVKGVVFKAFVTTPATQAVTAAQEAAAAAQKAAEEAEAVVANIQDVAADTAAAKAAAQAAAAARAAAAEAQRLAEQAATTAAANAAETAAQKAAEETEEQLSEYVSDAEAAKTAAEKARDEAQAAVGGDYLDRHTYDPTGKKTDVFAYVDQKVANIPTPDVSGQIGAHNTDGAAHTDIRALITGLATRLNALADSDDTTLDQMSEVVAYIKSNKSLIDAITTAKVSVADIVNDLVTNNAKKPLSAAQGVVLKTLVDAAAGNGIDKMNVTGGDAIEATLKDKTLTIKAKTVEEWTFTLEDDRTITKKVVLA